MCRWNLRLWMAVMANQGERVQRPLLIVEAKEEQIMAGRNHVDGHGCRIRSWARRGGLVYDQEWGLEELQDSVPDDSQLRVIMDGISVTTYGWAGKGIIRAWVRFFHTRSSIRQSIFSLLFSLRDVTISPFWLFSALTSSQTRPGRHGK